MGVDALLGVPRRRAREQTRLHDVDMLSHVAEFFRNTSAAQAQDQVLVASAASSRDVAAPTAAGNIVETVRNAGTGRADRRFEIAGPGKATPGGRARCVAAC